MFKPAVSRERIHTCDSGEWCNYMHYLSFCMQLVKNTHPQVAPRRNRSHGRISISSQASDFLTFEFAVSTLMVLHRIAFLVGAALAAAPVSQVRMALTTDVNDCASGMAVQFASTDAAAYDVTFYVEGDQDNAQTVQSTSENYAFTTGNYSYASPELHKASLCDLAPSTRYTYTVGNKTHSFLTPMTPGCDDAPTVIGVVGDPGDTILDIQNHVHGYERTAPIVNNKIDHANGVVYITTGAGGNFEGPASNSTLAKLPEWSLKRNNQVYGSSKVIATRESLELLWFSEDDGDKPWDSVTLTPRNN
ncbi:Aste57867_16638 [Aphanomyces stellatus]|uniref:Aste57867_16638 protein n=1 Tax=Aphanomyces stellatus TaxID=120398 RepID=A0A485L750_9STRA|nr:hypothetical protein As57867_016581 [Aphanomyces stellatus]VFT93409.1 Aste57867_16638 [Aphanomyces stellatus]